MKPTWHLITSTALAAALLAGCSAGDFTSESGNPSEQATTAASDGAGQNAEAAAGDSGAGVADVDTSKVLAEQEYEIPGSKDKVTFGVQSLVVDGDTMRLPRDDPGFLLQKRFGHRVAL